MTTAHKKPALEPTILVIFGITGDLSRRYLLPALYDLVKNDMLHEQTEIIGVTRGTMQLDELLAKVELCVSEAGNVCNPAVIKKLKSILSLRQMDVTEPTSYDELLTHLNKIEDNHGTHMNRLYYLSIPPNVARPIITFLGEHGLNTSCPHGAAVTRLLTEKPFGYDTESARELIKVTAKQFGEEQVYRIDHYLAKETVQNILGFRFNNPIFEPLWNAEHIDCIEVLANEKIGIEGRVNFYEKTGALRDFVQSHLLQILALVTMEQPSELTSDTIHANKLKLMRQIQTVPADKVNLCAIRGQYESYKDEVANENTSTETYAALRVMIDNERWNGVPAIIKTGKNLNERLAEVNVVFKPTDNNPHHNVLTFRIQPNEAIEMTLRVKKPGYDDETQKVEMDFEYNDAFTGTEPTAYERVLVDAVRGDHTLFATAEEVMESWRVVQPIVDEWQKDDNGLKIYKQGSTGPDVSGLYK